MWTHEGEIREGGTQARGGDAKCVLTRSGGGSPGGQGNNADSPPHLIANWWVRRNRCSGRTARPTKLRRRRYATDEPCYQQGARTNLSRYELTRGYLKLFVCKARPAIARETSRGRAKAAKSGSRERARMRQPKVGWEVDNGSEQR